VKLFLILFNSFHVQREFDGGRIDPLSKEGSIYEEGSMQDKAISPSPTIFAESSVRCENYCQIVIKFYQKNLQKTGNL
jgi:hypothetical protein